ncbi:hypothetical protein OG453_44365 [Streptomyces sp. NBC_01381]|uniref:hypothetical protein n=1 Tax=Streptomyces sp. NBC_01381 TaxID=2903845 RepID=UPI00224E3B83|nr:hypothetical protein [Streptomyces sp. NBC_01381]MCX4673593.1 hypothetical protein [Streptomyces sp. NBC_01381]
MGLAFDHTKRVVGLRRQVELVEAVVGASSGDESRWLEWKSTLDLSKAEGRFSVARGILGMANRMPDIAARYVEGHGYFLVGVEEGAVHGVDEHDVEKVVPWLERYLGSFDRYDLTYVPIEWEGERRKVLLVDVVPPQWGDPLFPLRRDYDTYREGTVFHRSNGCTEPARAKEIDALSARARRAAQQLAVRLSASGAVTQMPPSADIRLEVLRERREALLAQLTPRRVATFGAAEEDGSRDREALSGMSTAQVMDLRHRAADGQELSPQEQTTLAAVRRWERRTAAFLGLAFPELSALSSLQRDARTPDRFRQQVDAYIEECQQAQGRSLLQAVSRRSIPLIVRMTNPSEDFIQQVKVVVTLPADVWAYDPEGDAADWPSVPKTYGTVSPFLPGMRPSILSAAVNNAAFRQALRGRHGPDIDNDRARAVITFPARDVRGSETVEFSPLRLFTRSAHAEPAHAEWTATATNVSGVERGQLALPVLTTKMNTSSTSTPMASASNTRLRPAQRAPGIVPVLPRSWSRTPSAWPPTTNSRTVPPTSLRDTRQGSTPSACPQRTAKTPPKLTLTLLSTPRTTTCAPTGAKLP